MVYGGTIASGNYKGKKLDIVSAFEALGEKNAGTLNDEEYKEIIKRACPGAGACGGMYTANTMSSSIEALGFSLPFNASLPAEHPDKNKETKLVASAIDNLIKLDIKPLDIITKKSLENAITVVIALGGSTNSVLHYLAIAKAAKIPFELDDFQRISDRTPVLADLKPSGKYLMEDVHSIGGTPAVMKYLLNNGYLHGECLTVTGKTIAENLATIKPMEFEQTVIHNIETAVKKTGHIQILRGNLAPKGSVAKITGKEGILFSGKAKVFNSEQEANDGIANGLVEKGDVIVIRYVGPRGGPGMPEMLKPTSMIMGAGLGKAVALITDGRFSGGTHGFVVGHITPEAQDGGPIALIKEGDTITIDVAKKSIDLNISEKEFEARRKAWVQPELRAKRGIL